MYTTLLFGKGFGWFIAVNVLLEYVLAASTVAIGCSNYIATLFNQPATLFQLSVGNGTIINPLAAGILIALTIALCFGIKESFWLNSSTVLIAIVAIFITIIAGK